MTAAEVRQIAEHNWLPPGQGEVELIETHISWVLMGDTRVYKLKKPLQFSFLDFPSLEQRKHYCQLEVELNRRLAPQMYLGVLPVTREEGRLMIGGESGEVVDYAICMRRMDETLQMDLLIARGAVEERQVMELAEVVADFHLNAKKVRHSETWEELYAEFEDISSVRPYLETALGHHAAGFIDEVLPRTRQFLQQTGKRIEARKTGGFIVDGHGDLHCRNIFLTDPPVIFDCIEFSEDLRTLDMLNEAAFLCMDLERLGRDDLARAFFARYQALTGVIENETDQRLFLYYKMYRANVRLKVLSLQMQDGRGTRQELDMIGQYLAVFRRYYRELVGDPADPERPHA